MAKGTLEHRIENIFEGLFARAFKSKVTPMQIGRRLLQTADSESETDAHGRRVVPNTFIIQLSADDREGFADVEPALLYELTEALRMHVKTSGYHVEGKARVALRTSTELRRGRFDITAKTVQQKASAPRSRLLQPRPQSRSRRPSRPARQPPWPP